MNQDSTLDLITLVIPTYNRPEHLYRLLKYYEGKQTDVSILVLDSSNKLNKNKNKQIITNLLQSINYLSFPEEITPGTKLFRGLESVKTEFCVFCADDDLIFLDGIKAALLFLMKNDDFVCVDGIYINFSQINMDVVINIEYALKGAEGESVGERLFKFYQNYESIFYGVYRVRDLYKIFSGVSQNQSLHFQELFQSTATLLMGKTHRMPIIYAARQSCDPADPGRDNWQTCYWFASNRQEMFIHYDIYRNHLIDFYTNNIKRQEYSPNELMKLIDIVHAMFFSAEFHQSYFYSLYESKWKTLTFKKPCDEANSVLHDLRPGYMCLFTQLRGSLNTIYQSIFLNSFIHRLRLKWLNYLIFKETQTKWRCLLSRNDLWISRMKTFKIDCKELCCYLSIEKKE